MTCIHPVCICDHYFFVTVTSLSPFLLCLDVSEDQLKENAFTGLTCFCGPAAFGQWPCSTLVSHPTVQKLCEYEHLAIFSGAVMMHKPEMSSKVLTPSDFPLPAKKLPTWRDNSFIYLEIVCSPNTEKVEKSS